MLASRFIVDGKWWHHDNRQKISLPEFFSNTNPNWPLIVAFSNFPRRIVNETIWCVFRVRTLFASLSCVVWMGAKAHKTLETETMFMLTFCDFSATMSTKSKSYIPSATSYIWLTSTKKRTYLRASSDVTNSASVAFKGCAEIKRITKVNCYMYVSVKEQI